LLLALPIGVSLRQLGEVMSCRRNMSLSHIEVKPISFK